MSSYTVSLFQSGLTEKVRQSKIDEKAAEQQILQFVMKYAPKSECPLAGNNIGMDRMFLAKYMPNLIDHLHYRVLDVSTVKELTRFVNVELFVYRRFFDL